MDYLERFKKRMGNSGNSLKDAYANNARNYLNKVFDNDVSNIDGVYFWEHGKMKLEDYQNNTPINIRLYDEKFSTANGVTIKFQTKIDCEIAVGDILYVSEEDEFWICTYSKCVGKINYQGTLLLCNWVLKWQNRKGVIFEYPCQDLNSTQYNSGEQSNQTFTIGSSQHIITLPSDENTIALNSKVRCYLDKNKEEPTVYRVTQNDTTSYNYGKKGLVKVTFFEDVRVSDTDRIDLGICDYIEVDEKGNIDNTSVKKCVIEYATTQIKCGGTMKKFTAKFYDNDEEVSGVKPVWEIIPSEIKDSFNIQKGEDSISIGTKDKNLIDETIGLKLSEESGEYTSQTIAITIKSLL